MLEPFLPSLIIVASVAAAFAAGRVLAIVAGRFGGAVAIVRVAVALVSIAFAVLFATNGSSRYALLLPAGFALGFFAYGRSKFVPGVFR